MEKIVKKSNILSFIKVIILSIIVALIAYNFISQKENLTIDELYTYGLSNTHFQPDIVDYEEYSGKNVFLNYAIVKKGQEFDIKNVFFNQKMDTHPPLYYLFVNFISSINSNRFSIWHGLIINLVFLIAVFWEMRWLFIQIIDDKISSTILTLLSFFTYGFINEIGFTRMYVMLTFFSMAFVILVINKIKNSKGNDIFFIVLFYIICLLGMLTQYHFAIIAFFFSVILAIKLIKEKKYRLLTLTITSGILSLLTAYIIFNPMFKHIASGDSLHSLSNNETVSIASNFIEMLLTIKLAFFGIGIYIYLILLIILVLINLVLVKKNPEKKEGFKNFNAYYIYILLSCIFYYAIISITTKFTFERYLYNIYPLIIISLLSPIYILLKNIKKPLRYITMAVIFTLCVTSAIQKNPTNLCLGDALFEEYLYENKDVKTILLYNSMDENGNENTMSGTTKWKLPYPFYLFRHMENMTFADTSYEEFLNTKEKSVAGYNDIILVIYNFQNDDELIETILKKNNVSNVNKLYFSSYIHVYRLSN